MSETQTSKWNVRLFALTGLVLAAAAMRLLAHPPNVTPIAAMALFGGAHFASKRAAFLVPLAAMLISDLVLAVTVYGTAGLGSRPFVYGSFAVVVLIGMWVRRNGQRPLPIATGALGGSLLFFIVTNFGVWLRGTLYPLTLEGLMTCYTAAIPFFRHTLIGDGVYTLALFGGFAVAQRYAAVLREPPMELSVR